MRCTAYSLSPTVASKDASLPLSATSAPCVRSKRATFAGVCPSDSRGVRFYLDFKHSLKRNYALRLLPRTPVTRRPRRIGAVMLMQGDGMLLAFEVWPSPLCKGLAFTAFTRQVVSSGLSRLAGRIPVIRFVCKKP